MIWNRKICVNLASSVLNVTQSRNHPITKCPWISSSAAPALRRPDARKAGRSPDFVFILWSRSRTAPRDAVIELVASPVKAIGTSSGSSRRPARKIKGNEEFRAQLAPSSLRLSSSSATAASFRSGCSSFRARQHQCARFAASEVSRRGADSMGDCERRNRHWRDHHAHRRGARYRRHPAATGTPNRTG